MRPPLNGNKQETTRRTKNRSPTGVQADFDPKEAAREPTATQVDEVTKIAETLEKEDTDVEKNDPSKHNEPLLSEEKQNLNDAGRF